MFHGFLNRKPCPAPSPQGERCAWSVPCVAFGSSVSWGRESEAVVLWSSSFGEYIKTMNGEYLNTISFSSLMFLGYALPNLHNYIIWLVVWKVWNMNFIFPYIGNNKPNWLSYFFQRDWNHQPDTMNGEYRSILYRDYISSWTFFGVQIHHQQLWLGSI